MRVYHRYLGFFLAGIMSIYAVSGVLMIFRNTDFLKSAQVKTINIPPNTPAEELGRALRVRDFKADRTEGTIVYFKQGNVDTATGVATITTKELPRAIQKLEDLHKATTKSPLFFLNIFFGASLLFFVISAFWMFMPSSDTFKKGIYFTLGGILLALIMLFV